MKASINKAGNLVIEIEAETKNPAPSASGKSLVIASTRGNKPTELEVNGKKVVLGLTAYVPTK